MATDEMIVSITMESLAKDFTLEVDCPMCGRTLHAEFTSEAIREMAAAHQAEHHAWNKDPPDVRLVDRRGS